MIVQWNYGTTHQPNRFLSGLGYLIESRSVAPVVGRWTEIADPDGSWTDSSDPGGSWSEVSDPSSAWTEVSDPT
jgi:hypothetical protein